MKIRKNDRVGGRVGGDGSGGDDGCRRRIEVFVKIQKNRGGGGSVELGGGVRVDVNDELSFCCCLFLGVGSGGGRVGQRVGGSEGGYEGRIEVFVKIQKKSGRGGGGVRVWGQGGCEQRIEVFVKIKKVKIKTNWG